MASDAMAHYLQDLITSIVFSQYREKPETLEMIEERFLEFLQSQDILEIRNWKYERNGENPILLSLSVQSTLLHFAVRYRMLTVSEWLLNQGISLNAVDFSFETPLFKAAANCHEAMVKLLLSRGADPNIPNRSNYFPLHITYDANVSLMLIQAGAFLNVVTLSEFTPLFLAKLRGNQKKITVLLEAGAETDCILEGDSDMHRASILGNVAVVSDLFAEKFEGYISMEEGRKKKYLKKE